DREKEVIEALSDADESTMWQKSLQRETGSTKSKLSRTLKKMEERGLVEKIQHGTSNKVRLRQKD
ncbi:MAG: helix-turn-helix transcriptional regulator, partial [Candidatus Aenigmatarchaeota archaeon]